MTIDPGTQRLGWSVSQVDCSDGKPKISWMARGTVFSKGKGCEVITGIVANVRKIQEEYNVEMVFIEDYIFIPGKTSGVFAVPALIGVLKHDWFVRMSNEPVMIEAATWKGLICGAGNANKAMVRESLHRFLTDEQIIDIETEFKQHALKRDQESQDCFDAVAIDLYVQQCMRRNMKLREVLLDGKELQDASDGV